MSTPTSASVSETMVAAAPFDTSMPSSVPAAMPTFAPHRARGAVRPPPRGRASSSRGTRVQTRAKSTYSLANAMT